MSRCQSWVPVENKLNQGIPSRPLWRPCHNKVEQGAIRCDECWILLATHPDPSVRRNLAAEDDIPSDIVDLLREDVDPTVRELVGSLPDIETETRPLPDIETDNEDAINEEVPDPWQ